MKKIFTFIFCCSFLFSISVNNTFGQVGSICDSAYNIHTLPFSATGLTTATSGNNYTGLSCSGTLPNFMGGNDYVFSYTPITNQDIKVTLKNTTYLVGVFITNDCPDSATGCIASNTSITGNPVIPTASLTAFTTYYITVSGVTGSTAFDIEINELFALDAATAEIITPASNCGLTNAEVVTVKYRNLGIQSINNFKVGYSLNGNPISPILITTALNPNDSLVYTFAQTADLSAIATYQLSAFIILTGEQNSPNDTITRAVAHQSYVNTLPYLQDFESGDGGWTPGGTNSSWALGTPASTVINTAAAGGQNSWKTNLTGNFNLNENSYVLGPCFDFTNYPNVSMKMDIWYQTGPMLDGARVEASINGGTSWFLIGGNNEPTHWYNAQMTDTVWTGSAGGWLTAQHFLNFCGGHNNVRLRIVYTTGMLSIQTAEGFAFDNIRIYECDTMPTSSFNAVVNGNIVTVTNTSTKATGYLWNFGDQLSLLADTNTNSSHTYATPSTYNITLSAFNECGVSNSSQTVTITSTVGINDINYQDLNIYPNPAKDVLNVRLNNSNGVINKIQIFNILGQVIYINDTPKTEEVININKLNKGVYYITVTTDNKLFTKKFTVE